MGNEYFGLPPELFKWLDRWAPQRLAIETGTFRGETARVLARTFDRVITIERNPDLARQAQQLLQTAGLADRVNVICGDSAEFLAALLPRLNEPAVFWLDGHWLPRIEVDSRPQCSVLRELAAIRAWPLRHESMVLVDDMHLFESLPAAAGYRSDEWPTRAELDSEVRAWDGSSLAQHDDVLIIAPPKLLSVLP